jgi:hypothetical protein
VSAKENSSHYNFFVPLLIILVKTVQSQTKRKQKKNIRLYFFSLSFENGKKKLGDEIIIRQLPMFRKQEEEEEAKQLFLQ